MADEKQFRDVERRYPLPPPVDYPDTRDYAVRAVFIQGQRQGYLDALADQGKPQITDDELIETYRQAVDRAMRDANERDGFASSGSRESIVAGLRAVVALGGDE